MTASVIIVGVIGLFIVAGIILLSLLIKMESNILYLLNKEFNTHFALKELDGRIATLEKKHSNEILIIKKRSKK